MGTERSCNLSEWRVHLPWEKGSGTSWASSDESNLSNIFQSNTYRKDLCFGDTSNFFMKLQQIFFVAISSKFSFMSHSNLFRQQIGGKITLFLLSFFFSNIMSNVQVIAAIILLLNDEDEQKENVQEHS